MWGWKKGVGVVGVGVKRFLFGGGDGIARRSGIFTVKQGFFVD